MKAPTCTLVFDYVDGSGRIHCHASCGLCYTLQFAYSLAGPWYDERPGQAGDDIIIEANDQTRSAKFYRVVPRVCGRTEQSALAS